MNDNQDYVRRIAEHLEATDPYTFFEKQDIYDLEFTVDANLDFKSGKAMIACGGPNIFINSCGSVDLYWCSEEAHWYLSSDCKSAVEDYFEEMYQTISA